MRSLSIATLVLVAACGSSSTENTQVAAGPSPTEPPGVAPPSPQDEPREPEAGSDVPAAVKAFDDALASAVCERLDACCANADYDTFFQRFKAKPYEVDAAPPRAQCASGLSTTFAILHDKWAKSAVRGRVKYDAARGKACIDAIKATACGVPLATVLSDDKCLGTRGNEVFTKITPLGAACEDIQDGTFFGECDPTKGFCGSNKVCEAWSQTGEPCSVIPTRKFCASSLACDGGSPSKPGSCSAAPVTRKLGESCTAISGPLEYCEAGTYCDYVGGTCVAVKADGASCTADDECASFHPYSCSPIGAGKCGSVSFCSGANK